MTTPIREITRADILPMEAYAKVRTQRRRQLIAEKQKRRLEIGPVALLHFENYETMWFQVHEMLFVEKRGEQQIPDELAAYNPLIPNGRELVATLLFEIDDPARRAALLGQLGGVEETLFVRLDGAEIAGIAEADVDRTNAAGKASAVQFVHFPFSDAQVDKFRAAATEVVVGIRHPAYPHMTVMSAAIREALSRDFD